MLYLITTPIGNLADLSLRALETLKKCDYLLCEDTRRSLILLDHYGIKKPLESYHLFNEAQKEEKVIADLKKGLDIGLLSDGGTPGVCDPGEALIKSCLANDLPFTTIPGPCALVQALLLSGLPLCPFQFLGFVPRKESALVALLPSLLSFEGTSIFYESPQRLVETLGTLASKHPTLSVAVARELTKTYEEVIRGTSQEVHSHFLKTPPRGEIVLLIQGGTSPFSDKSPQELVQELQEDYGLSPTLAVKTTAHLLCLPKQTVYKLFHSEK